ncbi:MAG: AAA family ATPase [Oscillospiraceae bacterium]|nr:AAA family ATPase [Oscillospiraceae bacterium]
MGGFSALVQLIVMIIVGYYFILKLKNDSSGEREAAQEAKGEAEKLNALRHIRLNEPMTELARPGRIADIIGQDDGVKALRAALWGANPQHVLIYGPPGVGKTAAARIVMEDIKRSPDTPFEKNAPFIEADAAIMRCDERGFADPLIGSVHDPIYQGAGAYGIAGVPQPKAGAVTKAHGGILFLDEIGELPNEQINKLLKVLEDRRVILESSYYSRKNRKIPVYIRDIFDNGLPADFRLIGATTRKPEEIPEAVRSRCVEVYFNPLSRADIVRIITEAALRCGAAIDNGVREIIADYSSNGREAVKLLQSAVNVAKMEGRPVVSVSDAKWVVEAGHCKKNKETPLKPNEKITKISFVKPEG